MKATIFPSDVEKEDEYAKEEEEENEFVPMVMCGDFNVRELKQSIQLCNLSQKNGYKMVDFGLEERSWVSFMKGFKSMKDFLIFHSGRGGAPSIESMEEGLVNYFDELKTVKQVAPTSLQSILALMKKFWVHTGRGDLAVRVPSIQSDNKKWMKIHLTKKAYVFTKEELCQYQTLADGKTILVRKVHSVVAVGSGGRCGELWNMTFDDFARSIDQKTGNPFYRVRTEKLKNVRQELKGSIV